MADTGAISPGTMADDATVGTVAWSNPDNAKVSDGVYARVDLSPIGTDKYVYIVKSDGTIGTTNKADAVTTWPATDTYISYGSSSDLWGETWTPSDINNSNFGVVFSAKNASYFSHYLKATNFGFSIPTGATINGILVEIEKGRTYSPVLEDTVPAVDHIKITVYYTEGGTPANTTNFFQLL